MHVKTKTRREVTFGDSHDAPKFGVTTPNPHVFPDHPLTQTHIHSSLQNSVDNGRSNNQNGTPAANADLEMKEEAMAEVVIAHVRCCPPTSWLTIHKAPLDSIQQAADLSDPQLPPQPATGLPEHLSTIHPATMSTPPATSAPSRPDSMTPVPSAKPEKPVAHGGPTRQYLNQNVTPHLLEAMKYLAVYEPEKPLMWLADFLRDRSKEVEV